jgi:hypothetical protein
MGPGDVKKCEKEAKHVLVHGFFAGAENHEASIISFIFSEEWSRSSPFSGSTSKLSSWPPGFKIDLDVRRENNKMEKQINNRRSRAGFRVARALKLIGE